MTIDAPESPYLVPFDGSFRVRDASTTPITEGHLHRKKHRKEATSNLNKLQRVLAAGDRHSVLIVFQAMDAAGKDSKRYMQARVASIIVDALRSIGLKYPTPSDEDRAEFESARAELT